MKTKKLILIAIAAVITLSFSFTASKRDHAPVSAEKRVVQNHSEPTGGFVSEDKLF